MRSSETEELQQRIYRVEQRIQELKAQGQDTYELENELTKIKKDVEIGLIEVAKIRLEELEKKLKNI